jgi:putative DNA primase/helicase
MRDGRVPWQVFMVPIIELLEGAADETETELSPTGETQISTSVPVEAFPLDVLPKPLARLVREASMALPCPPDYVAVPILGVMGTAIGTSRVIEVKANWHEGPRLNEAVVGDPGTKKSPAMKLAMKPLFRQQEADERTYNDAKSFHEAEMKRHEVDMEVWRKDAKAGKSAPSTPPSAPDAPTMSRSWSSNSTVEALALLLKENPRGILLY